MTNYKAVVIFVECAPTSSSSSFSLSCTLSCAICWSKALFLGVGCTMIVASSALTSIAGLRHPRRSLFSGEEMVDDETMIGWDRLLSQSEPFTPLKRNHAGETGFDWLILMSHQLYHFFGTWLARPWLAQLEAWANHNRIRIGGRNWPGHLYKPIISLNLLSPRGVPKLSLAGVFTSQTRRFEVHRWLAVQVHALGGSQLLQL